MSALAGVRRRRTAIMVAANLFALVALAGMGYAGVTALRNYEGATRVTSTSQKLPVTPVAMLGTVDDADVLTSVTVFVLSSGQQGGGNIVSLPASTDSTPGIGTVRTPLASVYATGGVDALTNAVESALSITIDFSSVLAAAELEPVLAPVSPVKLTLATDVLDGADEVPLFTAGENSLSAAQVVEVLTAVADGQPHADRRANIEAVWAGVAESIGAGRTAPDLTVAPTDVPSAIERVFAAASGARALPVSPADDEQNPEQLDVDTLDRAEAVFTMASIAPSSMTTPSPGLVFRIEAPPGYEARVRVAVAAVLFLGGNVKSVYLEAETHPETRLYLSDESLESQASSNNAYFGATQTLTAEVPIEGIDVVLQLGTEFLEAEGTALPSTTTTTSEPE
jgi:hypothetical protein